MFLPRGSRFSVLGLRALALGARYGLWGLGVQDLGL